MAASDGGMKGAIRRLRRSPHRPAPRVWAVPFAVRTQEQEVPHVVVSGMKDRKVTRTRRPRKLDGKIVLYVPDSFDPQAHLPDELRHLADYARYLLHRIIVGRVHQRRGDNLVPLKHDYLVKFFPEAHYLAVRDALMTSGVIHVRKFCVPNQIAYGFRLLPPYNQGFSARQPTTERLIRKIRAWRKAESREVRLPLHRDLRRHIKSITIDEGAALASVRGTPFQRSSQVMTIRRIAGRDFFTVADRFGRFHSNLTNLKSSLRAHLRHHDSPLVNLDIANSQPMIFCLLLVNLLSGGGKLDDLLKVDFPETNNPYHIEIDEAFLSSLFPCSSISSAFSPPFPDQTGDDGDGRGGDTGILPILPGFKKENRHKDLPRDKMQQHKLSQVDLASFPEDVVEFIDLCERGILYDELMKRLDIPSRRRKSFKRLFYAQVFFGKVKKTGRVTELFARDFPTVFEAVCELKRKDYRRMAYLLQAHESRLMIDIIARRILAQMPGTFIGTIHDSIMTTPDRAESVKEVMVEEFQRFGLKPTIRLESYPPAPALGEPTGRLRADARSQSTTGRPGPPTRASNRRSHKIHPLAQGLPQNES